MKLSSIVSVTVALVGGTFVQADDHVCEKSEYDYVVIGSGPAGASAAFKLSEDPNNSVLLLEEGGYSLYPNKGVQEIWKGEYTDRQ